MKSEHVLHVIKPRTLRSQPLAGFYCAAGKSHARTGFVCEFYAFAIGGEHHRMIADDIATAECVHADLAGGACSGEAKATVNDVLVIIRFRFLIEDFEKSARGTGRGIDLMTMVHFRDLDIKMFIAEDARGVAGEPEQRIDADGKIWGVDDGKRFCGGVDDFALRFTVAGGADHQASAMFQGVFDEFCRERVDGKIDDRICLRESCSEVLAGIVRGSDLDTGLLSGGDDRLAHAAGLARNKKFGRKRHGEWSLEELERLQQSAKLRDLRVR